MIRMNRYFLFREIHKCAHSGLCSVLLLLTGVVTHGQFTAVDTIADLRNVNPTNYSTVLVADYYAPTDFVGYQEGRGGGLFKWQSGVSLSDDGGLYIQSNYSAADGRWKRFFQGEAPNVKMWGAVGNGVDNDYVAMQNAINTIRGRGTGLALANELLIPAGDYLVTNSLVIWDTFRLRGEGAIAGSTIIMDSSISDKDIIQTQSAEIALKGSLTAVGNGTYTSPYGTVRGAHGLVIEDLAFQFGTEDADVKRGDITGAAICMTGPWEVSKIRNIHVWGGGFGVRVLGGGTPGLRAENLGLFYQSIAGICIEGLEQADGTIYGLGGPVTLTSISGDSFSTSQAQTNSLILFSNYFPNVTITDLSAEGTYGGGLIRCVAPPSINHHEGEITVIGGTYDAYWNGAGSGVYEDFVVLENPHADTYRMPVVTLLPTAMYGVRYLIADEWADRYIPTPASDDQLPVRRTMHYSSSATGADYERRSLLVIGDNAYYSFIPSQTGWYRIISAPNKPTIGGRLTISSLTDTSTIEFSLGRNSGHLVDVVRTSKADTGKWAPIVTKVRGYAVGHTSLSRGALDIYVENLPATDWPFNEEENRYLTLTMPLEGRTQAQSGVSIMSTLVHESDASVTTTNPNYMLIGSETYISDPGTGVISITR